MTPFYLPDDGPSQLGRAMFFVGYAYLIGWMRGRGVGPGNAQFDEICRYHDRAISFWQVGYLLTQEEAESLCGPLPRTEPSASPFLDPRLGEPYE